jgi:hypothetical protein
VTCDCSSAATGATTATTDYSVSSRDTAVTYDTTQIYSMAPLHTSVQVKAEPVYDAVAALAGSSTAQSMAIKQEATAAVVVHNSSSI